MEAIRNDKKDSKETFTLKLDQGQQEADARMSSEAWIPHFLDPIIRVPARHQNFGKSEPLPFEGPLRLQSRQAPEADTLSKDSPSAGDRAPESTTPGGKVGGPNVPPEGKDTKSNPAAPADGTPSLEPKEKTVPAPPAANLVEPRKDVVTASMALAMLDFNEAYKKNDNGNFLQTIIGATQDFLTKRNDTPLTPEIQEKIVDLVQRDHFRYFQEHQDPKTGLIYDRSNGPSPASIAAVGFALTAYPVAADRQWIDHDEARDWTLKVLRNLATTPQGDADSGTSGTHGFFYHMLDPETGLRSTKPKFWNSELSTIDTGLLMMGVLYSKEYFKGTDPKEQEIRTLADNLYRRVEWDWLADADGLTRLSWTPEEGKSTFVYKGYNEAVLMYLLGMGSPTHPLPDKTWKSVIGAEKTEKHYGQEYVKLLGAPLFTYQYPHTWIDFRNVYDAKAKENGFDWFENSRRATLAQNYYATANPNHWKGYDKNHWGQTACDGPGWFKLGIDNGLFQFSGYRERGAPEGYDDGTIAPTAAISSAPFAPEIVMPTMIHWLRNHPNLYNRHGFADAFNSSVQGEAPLGWIAPSRIGIDQGPIVLMLENQRSGKVWETMRGNYYLQDGMRKAGFKGGWLPLAKP